MTQQNPFGGNPFDPAPAGQPQPGAIPAGVPPVRPDEVNTLATLSVVFAFIFAPAGAILGHLGLSQMVRTRQRGRERALVGVTLSYVFITAAVVSLVVWAALGHNDTGAPAAAPPTSSAIATPGPTSTTTTTTAPPPPTVAPTGLEALLPTAEEINAIPGMPAGMGLIGTQMGLADRVKDDNITINPTSCYPVFGVADSHGYDPAAQQAIHANGFHRPEKDAEPVEAVAGYPDAATAQSALRRLTDEWRSCGTTFRYSDPDGGGRTALWTVSAPADAGNGITTVTASAARSMTGQIYRAIAAKANVVVDVSVTSKPGIDRTPLAVAVTTLILNKIPGPR